MPVRSGARPLIRFVAPSLRPSPSVTSTSTVWGWSRTSNAVPTAVKIFKLDGAFVRDVPLPGIGTAGGFGGKKTDGGLEIG